MTRPLYQLKDYKRKVEEESSQKNLEPEPYRSDWRRDYARLIHAPCFRRLQGKTQLFPGVESDFFRNRLTHSLEVAQIAKSITKDYIQPIESIISRLQPEDEGFQGTYVGKVSKASAHPDKNSRNESEITFNFVGDEDRLVNAKVFLNEEAFSLACQALDQGSIVKINGLLRTSGRSKVIENPVLELVE